MDFKQEKAVKVRVDALGTRIIGIIGIPPPLSRVSDHLNSHDEFLLVRQDGTENFVAKNAISYLEALEEGKDKGSRPAKGHFHPVTVLLRKHAGTLTGELFIPEGSTLQAALIMARRFINLRNVKFTDSPETYDFLAVGKQELIMVRGNCRPADGPAADFSHPTGSPDEDKSSNRGPSLRNATIFIRYDGAMKYRIVLSALLIVFAAAGCDSPLGPGNCEEVVVITVDQNSGVVFSWDPSCSVDALQVRSLPDVSGSGGTIVWSLFFDAEAVPPPVSYGTAPAGTRQEVEPITLEPGASYRVSLFRIRGISILGIGSQDFVFSVSSP